MLVVVLGYCGGTTWWCVVKTVKMSSRKVKNPVRQSVRGRPGLDRGKSWEDPELDGPRPRQNTLKHCCRSVATFMCTQVGVGGIIVCYALVGASVFIALETQGDAFADDVVHNVTLSRNLTATKLWKDYQNFQFNESEWALASNQSLHEFQVTIFNTLLWMLSHCNNTFWRNYSSVSRRHKILCV